MLFGLKTATQTFQRLMDSVTARLDGVFVYLDDVLVAPETAELHELHLRQLFTALRQCGLEINEGKCGFGVSQIDILGHRVSERGICLLPDKVAAVRCFERPCSVKALQQFLGLVNFYRRFLPQIAAKMPPLTDALAGSPRQLTWSDSMTAAFEHTKKCLADATMLAHPITDAELRVNTDASSKAIAGAVHQVVQGHLEPLGFFSRQKTAAES